MSTRTGSILGSISGRLMLFGVVPALFAIAIIVSMGAINERRSVERAEMRILGGSASGAAAELKVRIDRWNDIAKSMAQTQSHGMFGKRRETSQFAGTIVDSFKPLIEGAFFVYEPNADGQDAAGAAVAGTADSTGRFAPSWRAAPGVGGGGTRLETREGVDTLEFYAAPKAQFAATGRADSVATEPYLLGGAPTISHVCPIVVDGKFAGVAGVDRSLATLTETAGQIRSRFGADVFVISSQGRFLAATAGIQGGSGELRNVSDSPYASVATRWMSATPDGGADTWEATDPVLMEPCYYAAERTGPGGWFVVTRRVRSEAMAHANDAVVRHVLIGAGFMVVGAGTMMVVSRRIAGRVRRAAEVADRIARADLTEVVESSAHPDETGVLMRSMRQMDENLNRMVGEVRQAGIRLNSTATEIGATSRQQEASTATFGAASNQIAAAVKEISATGRDLVRTMESVNRSAEEASQYLGAGRAGLQTMASVMNELDAGTHAIGEKLGAISDRSQKITAVITTITKVADQTNILSINAAIEAEKAGEYGAGFLVIAREIRRLADQTAAATLDIEQMVQQMQGAVSAGVMGMDRFADQVRRGVAEVATAGTQLNEIMDRVNSNSERFRQVNESVQAQSEGAQQISDAMSSLVANANQTAQSAREFGRAASDLQSAIGLLRDTVARFKLRE